MFDKNKIRHIYSSFDGKLVGNDFMKEEVCKAVMKLPDEIINFVTQKCWFLASIPDAYAFTFTGNDLTDQHLIFLSEDLLNENEEQILYTIIHEIGHVMLGHRNSVISRQSNIEIKQQEKEADAFARKYI